MPDNYFAQSLNTNEVIIARENFEEILKEALGLRDEIQKIKERHNKNVAELIELAR